MKKIARGKYAGINAVADDRGVISAAAMDQRGSLQKSIAKAKGVDSSEITLEHMSEFKSIVIDVLSQHASGVLLDPEFGLEAAKKRHDSGLLLAYEKTGYDVAGGGRLPDLLVDQTVSRLMAAGADCIKLLIYYDPFCDPAINDQKHVFVERIGAECAFYDVPYFLEFVSYDASGDATSLEYAKNKPEIVTGPAGSTRKTSTPTTKSESFFDNLMHNSFPGFGCARLNSLQVMLAPGIEQETKPSRVTTSAENAYGSSFLRTTGQMLSRLSRKRNEAGGQKTPEVAAGTFPTMR